MIEHICGLQGYNPMIDPICPGCISRDVKLNKGDCRKLITTVPNESVDLIIIDPPYLTTNETWDKNEVVDSWLSIQLHRIAKETCSLYVWCGIGEKSQSLIRWFPIFNKDWYFKDLITWKKQRGIGGRKGWLYTREECMWFVKNNNKFIWNEEDQYSDEEYSQEWSKRLGTSFKRITNVWTDIKEETLLDSCGIKNNVKKELKHATPKPIEALQRIIEVHTNKGDVVFDCFAGTGTTAIAALKLNRKFLGFEKDHYQLANKRIIEYIENPMLFI